MMKRITWLSLLLLGTIPLLMAQDRGQEDPPPQFRGPQGGYAQIPDPQGPQVIMRTNPRIRRQLEEIKIWQMTREMNLPTDKSEKFFPLYNTYTDEMREITSERGRSVQRLDSLTINGANETQLKQQIDNIMNFDTRLADTHVKFIKSLGRILTPSEIARYIVFEQRFDREIRERIKMLVGGRMRARPR